MITNRIDRTTEIPREWKAQILQAPRSVKISLDDNCQFRCQFCSSRLMVDKHTMPWDMFCRLVDELVSVGVEEVGVFYIGEPFLAERLSDAIRYCKTAGIKYVFLTTNGHLATPQSVERVMDAGLDSLKFSFNYASPEQLKEVACVSPKVFGRIVQNIKSARRIRDDMNYSCGIYASSIMFDGEQGEKMRAAVEEILPYVDEHYWLPCFSFGGQTEFGVQVQGNPGRLDKMRESLPCWAVFREGHVTASGKVSLCCFDSHERWVSGDLNTGTFMDAWNSEKAQKLRIAHLNRDVRGTECEHCAVGK